MEHGPYHRLGEPGGPPARVTVLPITAVGADGEQVDAELLAATRGSSEVELLRAVCGAGEIKWGEDEFGWWAVVPNDLRR